MSDGIFFLGRSRFAFFAALSCLRVDRVTRLIGRVCGGTSSGRDGRPVAPRMVKCLLMPRCQRWCVRRTVMDRAAAVTQACGLALRPVCYLKLDVSDAATRGRCTASAV